MGLKENNMKKILINILMLTVLFGFVFISCAVELEEPRSVAIIRPEAEIPPGPVLYYSQFGAKGDGVTCDFEALRITHDAANIRGATVRADPGAVYYIGATTDSIRIQTDTDWRDARFIIDDTTVEMRGTTWAHSWLFIIESAQNPFDIYSISGLQRFQPQVPLNLGQRVMIEVIDNTTRRFIRTGANQNPGAFQRDIFIVEKDGTVFPDAPIIWDFNNISSMVAYPIDDHQLKVLGGHFTRIAHIGGNHIQPYMWRGIRITRSNVLIDGMYHEVIGESSPIVAYLGHLYITSAADVTIQNTRLSGRRVYGGKGTYDLLAETSINLTLKNVHQINSITNTTLWGIMASNYSKNIIFDDVIFSRFDAHQGVHNTTLLNSEFGHAGVLAVGSGTLMIDNVTTRGSSSFVGLRSDYGATWEGNIYIRNSRMFTTGTATIVSSQNNGNWNFGYPTFMPRFIYIDGFEVFNGTGGANWVQNTQFNAAGGSNPHALTERIFARNVVLSGVNEPAFGNIGPGRIPVTLVPPPGSGPGVFPWD